MNFTTKALVSVPMINSIAEPTRTHVVQIIEEVSQSGTVPAGTVLFQLGDDMDHTGIALLSGKVQVTTDHTKPFVVSAPELLGEMHQLNETAEHRASVKVMEEASILRFRWHDFVEKVNGNSFISHEQKKEIKRIVSGFAGQRLKELDASEAE